MIYLCCDRLRRARLAEENRRRALAGLAPLNGIDFLEVLDHDAAEAPVPLARQQTLLVRLFEPAPPLDRGSVRLLGGERITPVRVVWAFPAPAIPAGTTPDAERAFFAGLPSADRLLVVRTDSSGDHSTYRLQLVVSGIDPSPPVDFDPRFAAVDFSFKVECPSDFDCAERHACPPEVRPAPQIDYLAKDYASFRRLMLDRLSLLMPEWRERHAADLGVALVELLAYVGDRLSYQQDAVATEAYLGTARRRVSVRRHAKLVDYAVHDGSNARAWVQVRCAPGTAGVVLPAATVLLTRVPGLERRLEPDPILLERALRARPVVFQTMTPLTLFEAHDRMAFHTWSDERCCLPKGATRATLLGHLPELRPGDALLLEEVVSPLTGLEADADRARRHVVRLTTVRAYAPGGGAPLTDPVGSIEITEIAWDPADALPFPFCVSSIADDQHGGQPVQDVSIARGNLVLADHGLTARDQPLGTVPEPTILQPPVRGDDRCHPSPAVPLPPRFRPSLDQAPLTQAAPYDPTLPAAAAVRVTPDEARPQLRLRSTFGADVLAWEPFRDLLDSGPLDPHFVVEVERDGRAFLRFGDDRHGLRPEPGTAFVASWLRVGNGAAGNVGAEAIHHVVTPDPAVAAVRNPLPAAGGREPESMEEVRQRAPVAFRTQERAVTGRDYAAVAERHPGLQRAAATMRWTGSWHTAFVTADRTGGVPVDRGFEGDLLRHLEPFRMAGVDLDVDGARPVSLELELHVCVEPGYFRSQVAEALLEVFSSRDLPDGRRGVFHPDHFTFGQTVLLSPLYAAAESVPGVASVTVTTFQRQGRPHTSALAAGRLALGRLEIARCDNDPDFPERGVFRLSLGGGK